MKEVNAKPERAKRRTRKYPTYQHRMNAVSVTVYSPTGETIPAAVRKEIEESVWAVAQKNQLLISIALT